MTIAVIRMNDEEIVITVTGTAANAKAGAVLVPHTDGEERGVEPVYIEGLIAWDDSLLCETLAVRGRLVREKFIPDPVDEDGAIAQGAFGAQLVLKDARWERVS